MKAKRRIPTEPIELDYLKPVNKFLSECKEIEAYTNKYGAFLASKHEELFPGKKVSGMLCLLKSKIANRLQYVAMKSAGVKMSDKFLQTYEASQKMDPSLYTEDSKFYIEQAIKKENDMGIMKRLATEKGTKTISKLNFVEPLKKETIKKAEVSTPKEQKQTPASLWIKLFQNNKKAKLTDKQIASEMKKQFPKNACNVVVSRQWYNAGKLSGQNDVKPLEKAFVAEK